MGNDIFSFLFGGVFGSILVTYFFYKLQKKDHKNLIFFVKSTMDKILKKNNDIHIVNSNTSKNQFSETPLFVKLSEIHTKKGNFSSFDINHDGSFIVALKSDCIERPSVYNTETGEKIQALGAIFDRSVREQRKRGKIYFFKKNHLDLDIIFHIQEDNHGVKIYQNGYMQKFDEIQTLSLPNEDYRNLGVGSISPNGQFVTLGTFSLEGDWSENRDRRFIIWDREEEKICMESLIKSSTENQAVIWNNQSSSVLMGQRGDSTILFKPYEEEQYSISDVFNGSFAHDLSWNPDGVTLACGTTTGLEIINTETKTIQFTFNDYISGEAELTRKHRKNNDYPEHNHEYAASSLSYSPDGKFLVSADPWGNLICRETVNYKIINKLYVSNSKSGYPLSFNWLPSDGAGLLITCRADHKEYALYFLNLANDDPLQEISNVEGGEFNFSKRNGIMAVKTLQKIYIYRYE